MTFKQLLPINSFRPSRLSLSLCLLTAAMCSAQISNAEIATGVMTVTATVAASCIVGTSTLAFGTTTSAAILAGNTDAQGAVDVNCTNGSAYIIALDIGAGSGATFASRTMTAGTNLLNYTVFTDTGRTTVWGDGTSNSITVSGIGTGLAQSLAAYGRIFADQNALAANYSDVIAVSVSY